MGRRDSQLGVAHRRGEHFRRHRRSLPRRAGREVGDVDRELGARPSPRTLSRAPSLERRARHRRGKAEVALERRRRRLGVKREVPSVRGLHPRDRRVAAGAGPVGYEVTGGHVPRRSLAPPLRRRRPPRGALSYSSFTRFRTGTRFSGGGSPNRRRGSTSSTTGRSGIRGACAPSLLVPAHETDPRARQRFAAGRAERVIGLRRRRYVVSAARTSVAISA